MGWQFGYNCSNYLPTLGKCRVLIQNYASRKDLLEQKWLGTQDLLVYLHATKAVLIERVASGDISVRRQKDGKLKFGIQVAAQFDDCPLADAGGQCLYFDRHMGQQISYLAELRDLRAEHPNLRELPTDEDVTRFESEVIQTLDGNVPFQ